MLSFGFRQVVKSSIPVVLSKNVRFVRRLASNNIFVLSSKGNFLNKNKSYSLSVSCIFHQQQRNITMSCSAVVEEREAFQRLPSTVVPKHYTLRLEPNLETFKFLGEESIDVQVHEETSEVLLNAADLEVSKAVWVQHDGSEQEGKCFVDEKKETLKVTFDTPLKNQGTLKLEFNGELNDKMKGFYRSKYRDADGVDRYNAVTQFESTDARRCFPCWDEPAIKSTFDVFLKVPKNKVALSNMPVKATSDDPNDANMHVVAYERTPIMSTYLVAFVIGDFDYVEARSEDGVLCRVYTPPGKKEQGRFALDVTVKVLPFYRDYFGISYPLPKMDLIAIADFASGAMENWGLITYRETCLLVDESKTSASSRQWIAIVVGHEIAHQWFGNLVTMEWWTHLWLNEGYASFVEFLCVDHLFPEYDIWTQFVTDTYIRALELDALESSHPIEVPVGHPSEIDEIFDDISYSKGAAVIRMLHDYIGINDFKKGMNIYLTRHQYGNAFTEDLWKALEEGSGKPVGDVMSTWTKQMGFPLISVTSKQVGNDRVLTLTQEKYVANPFASKESSQNYNWLIPLTFSTAKNPSKVAHEVLMDKRTMEVTIPDVDPNQLVKLNPGTVGYYRVRYSPEMLTQLIPAIREKSLPPLDRLGILDDIFSLVQSGQCSTTEVLQVLEAFIEEDVYTVWSSISNIIGKLNALLAYNEEDYAKFKAYGRRLFTRITEKLGWEPKDNETHLHTLLRTLVLSRMVTFENQEVIGESQMRFKDHLSGDKIIPADLRSCVYKAVLSVGDESVFESMLKLYRASDVMEEKDRIARALGSMKDPNLLRKVLEFAISEDVRNQDTIFVIIAVGMSKYGRDLAWEFFKEHIDLFKQRYQGGYMVSRVVKYVTENYVTEDKALEVENFFKDHPYPGTERSVQQSIESIRVNEAWLKRDNDKIWSYLKSVV